MRQEKKVLIVNTVEHSYNGITSVIRNYYLNMNREGLQIDFLVKCEPPEELRDEIERCGGRVFIIPRSNPLRYMRELRHLAKEEKYQVAHIHGNSATMSFELLPLKAAGVLKRIVSSHNTTCGHMLLHKFLYPYFTHAYTDALACGEQAGIWLFGRRPFTVLKNGVLLDSYEYKEEIRSNMRKTLNIKQDDIVLGHVGLFNEQKNQKYFVEIMKSLADSNETYRLLFVGVGEKMEEVQSLVTDCKLTDKVIFAGQTDRVSDYLQAMDVFVMPSLYEGLPVAAVEAQAAGLPCVLSESISRETAMGDDIEFVPLDVGAELWGRVIRKLEFGGRVERGKRNREALTQKGYSIKENADILRELYIK